MDRYLEEYQELSNSEVLARNLKKQVAQQCFKRADYRAWRTADFNQCVANLYFVYLQTNIALKDSLRQHRPDLFELGEINNPVARFITRTMPAGPKGGKVFSASIEAEIRERNAKV